MEEKGWAVVLGVGLLGDWGRLGFPRRGVLTRGRRRHPQACGGRRVDGSEDGPVPSSLLLLI